MGGVVQDFLDVFLFVQKIDTNADGNTYFGWAPPGSATSEAVWKMQRMSVSGTVKTFAWADGDVSMDNIWDNRTSLSYS